MPPRKRGGKAASRVNILFNIFVYNITTFMIKLASAKLANGAPIFHVETFVPYQSQPTLNLLNQHSKPQYTLNEV